MAGGVEVGQHPRGAAEEAVDLDGIEVGAGGNGLPGEVERADEHRQSFVQPLLRFSQRAMNLGLFRTGRYCRSRT